MNNNYDCYNEEMRPPFNLGKTKKHLTKVSLFVFVLAAISFIFQLLGMLLTNNFLPQYLGTYQYVWFLSIIPLYVFALPLAYLILRKAEKQKIIPDIEKFNFTQMLGLIGVSTLFMYVGNIIGIIITNIITSITGKPIDNTVSEILMGSPWYITIIAVVIIAPLGEEFIFRKLLIDRVNIYGQKFAILFSAIVFSLFHGNLNQLFYTFLLGLIFSYVYVKTGKLRYSIILHAVVNFFGGVVGPFITNRIDLDKLNNINQIDELTSYTLENLPVLLILFLYMAAVFGFTIAGLVVIITYRKKMSFAKGEILIPKNEFGNCVFYNLGTALYLAYSAVVIVSNCLGF